MNIENLIYAIKQAGPQLNTPAGNNKHEHVDRFQDALLHTLNVQHDYDWYAETIMSGGKHHDRADLYGSDKVHTSIKINEKNIKRIHPYSSKYNICEKTCDNDWFIEIDAIRADQVAAKFLSRLALLSLSSKIIHYVAILYSYSQNSEANCVKYCKFATEIMNKINSKSTVDLIIIKQGQNVIELYNLKKPQYKITYKHNEFPSILIINGMAAVVQTVVKNYISLHKTVTFTRLQTVFGKYVAKESGPSRYKSLGITLDDGTCVYTYSQWRNNYSSQENWRQFVNFCSTLGICITENNIYKSYNF